MKIKILIAAILACSCLTSQAWFAQSINQAKINQIQPGQTTEAELVQLFGPPDTKLLDIYHKTSLDWFRSVPPPVSSYIGVVGQFLGGLHLQVQQLSVVLGPSGTVQRYTIFDSTGAVKARTQVRTTVRETKYSK